MSPLAVGSPTPPLPLPGVGPTALFFYKVTCPVCQLAAPKVEAFERAYPGRIHGIGQDEPGKLSAFAERFGMTFPSVSDGPDYPLSQVFGIRVVPTMALVDRGVVSGWAERPFAAAGRAHRRPVLADLRAGRRSSGVPPRLNLALRVLGLSAPTA